MNYLSSTLQKADAFVPPPFASHASKGLAKRAQNFDVLVKETKTPLTEVYTRFDITRALACGVRDVSDGAKSLLHALISHLDPAQIAKGKTSVWPGAKRLTRLLGYSPAKLRRLKSDLEEAGYIIRNYDARNRPIHGDALDLKPFLIKVPTIIEMLAREDETEKQARANAKALRKDANEPRPSPESQIIDTKISTQVHNIKRHRNNTLKSSVVCLSKDEGQKADNKSTVTDAKLNIEEALSLSPRLREVIKTLGLMSSSPAKQCIIFDHMDEILKRLFDHKKEGDNLKRTGSMNHTWGWAQKRFGSKALVYLALALEDPKVKDPHRFFGWITSTAVNVDLSQNIARVAALHKPARQLEIDMPKEAGQGADLEVTQTLKLFSEKIAARIGVEAFNAWFGQKTCSMELKDGLLTLTVTSRHTAARITDLFAEDLRQVRGEIDFLNAIHLQSR